MTCKRGTTLNFQIFRDKAGQMKAFAVDPKTAQDIATVSPGGNVTLTVYGEQNARKNAVAVDLFRISNYLRECNGFLTAGDVQVVGF